MRSKSLGILVLALGLLLNGCAAMNESGTSAPKKLTAPAPNVQKLIDKFQLEMVDYAYVKKAIGNGTHGGATAKIIDARPHKKYVSATIPSSINIPDTKFDDFIGQLDDVAKDTEMIVFCGGWKCGKSPKVAGQLQKMGYTDVKLYQAGMPEWAARDYVEVGLPVVKTAVEKDSALLMDARPRKKFLGATIPGALSMYDKDLDRLSSRFPVDKNEPIIAFCGGYKCDKSHIVANTLVAAGYTDVRVFAAGLPGWKKAGLATTAGGGAKAQSAKSTTAAETKFVDGIKVGEDEGTVDGEWYNAKLQSGAVPDNTVLVDIRGPADFASGHIPGSINVKAGEVSATELAAKLPDDKISILVCGSGARAMEAYFKLKDGGKDVSKVMYFDANVSCDASNTCEIEANEPLGF